MVTSSNYPAADIAPAPRISPPAWVVFVLYLTSLVFILLAKLFSWFDSRSEDPASFLNWLAPILLLGLSAFVLLLVAIVLSLTYFVGNRRSIRSRADRVLFHFGLSFGVIAISLYILFFYIPGVRAERQRAITPSKYKGSLLYIELWLDEFHVRHGFYPLAQIPHIKPIIFGEQSSPYPADWFADADRPHYAYSRDTNQWYIYRSGETSRTLAPGEIPDMTGHFRYFSDGRGCILIGNGPDRDADLDARDAFLAARRDARSLLHHRYDPTNGVVSAGDVYILRID